MAVLLLPLCSTGMTKMPLPISSNSRLNYQLKQGQSRHFHKLPSGMSMEFIKQKAQNYSNATAAPPPPLVFIHGSFHAAWCWAEHWIPFFSTAGRDCYAISLLGQGESDVPEGKVAGTLETHTSDIADFIWKEVDMPPVLVGHSFGGLIVQSYLSKMDCDHFCNGQPKFGKNDMYPPLAGAVLACSVPPSGNSGLVRRYLLTKPIAAIKVTLSLAAKAFANSLPLCKETFFSSTMDDHTVQRYQILLKESSRVPLFDLRKLNASLPVPSVKKGSKKVLVIGASNDFIVDEEGLLETARFYDVEPICVEGVAHDMMLDSSWQKGAETILSWLKSMN